MKLKYSLFILFLITILTQSKAEESYLLFSGSSSNKISIIEKSTKKEIWNHPLEKGQETNCVDVNSKGEIVYSYKKGAKLISLDHTVIWDFPTAENTELQCAVVLPDGGYLLGICGTPSKIIELNKEGKVRKEITFDTKIAKPHSQFRIITKAKNGNYIVPLFGAHAVLELDKDGKEVNRYESVGNPFSVVELKNKDLLLSCGDAHQFETINRKTGVSYDHVKENDIKGTKLLFVAQITLLPNGNKLLCNWGGHVKDASVDEPQLFEINNDLQIVWSLHDKINFGRISSVKLIDNKKIISRLITNSK